MVPLSVELAQITPLLLILHSGTGTERAEVPTLSMVEFVPNKDTGSVAASAAFLNGYIEEWASHGPEPGSCSSAHSCLDGAEYGSMGSVICMVLTSHNQATIFSDRIQPLLPLSILPLKSSAALQVLDWTTQTNQKRQHFSGLCRGMPPK